MLKWQELHGACENVENGKRVRFGELQLTLDQNEKMGFDTMPKTMLEALELINEFKVKAPSSMQKPGKKFSKQYLPRQSWQKERQNGSLTKRRTSNRGNLQKSPQKKRLLGGSALNAIKRGIWLRSARTRQLWRRSWMTEPRIIVSHQGLELSKKGSTWSAKFRQVARSRRALRALIHPEFEIRLLGSVRMWKIS